MSEEDSKKTRRIDSSKIPDADVTHTAAPTGGTGGTEGLSGASSGTELTQPPDRFTLAAVLGEGSQGEVCKAIDNLLQRNVAIKFPHRVGDEGTAREILVEARKAARLNHPNVVTIYEVGFWKNRPFIAMELVEGVSLATVLKECGRISVDRYLRYARQILKALCAAHDSGLIHRDLKPHNVLLAADGTLKLTDFGVAHVRNELSGRDSTVNISIAGTPAYMAPEQWLGKKPDARSDIYAFGCLSFKLLAGKNVFPNEDTMQHHLETPAPQLRVIAPHVPENLEGILMRCLEKKAKDRFQSSEELLYAIDAAAQDEDAPGTAKWPAVETKSKRGGVLVTLLIIAIAAIGWFTQTEQGREQFDEIAASIGLGDKKKKAEKDPEPKVIEPSETEKARVENEKKGKALLAKAEEAASIDDKLNFANQALQYLAPNTAERERAAAIVVDVNEEKKRTTEKMVVSQFEGLIEDIKKSRGDGDINTASDKMDAAESLLEKNAAYLGGRSKELKQIKLPLVQDQADSAKDFGDFEAAREHYDAAYNIADFLGRKGQRDRFQVEIEICRKLGRLGRLISSQPGLVLHELRGMRTETAKLPATKLMTARAWKELGANARARKAIVTFITENSSSPLVQQAEDLKDSLDR